MGTPTLYMGLPNPTPFGDSGTWANEIVTCNTGFDTLAVSNFATVSATGTLTVYNGPALIQAVGGASGITLTLPDVTNGGANAKNEGRVYIIVKTDAAAGAITVDPFSGGQTISGASSLVISVQWTGYTIQSTASGWVVLSILDQNISGIVPVTDGGTGANLSATGGASNVVLQAGVGANFTVRQLAAADLSNGVTGTGAVVLASGATLSGSVTVSGTASFTTANPTFFSSTGSGAVVLGTGPTVSGATLSGSITVSGTATYTTVNPTFFSQTGTGAVVLAASPTLTGTAHVGRVSYDQGTAYTATDSAIVPSGNWGTGAAVSAAVGTDSGLQFTVTSGSTGLGSLPTIAITFKDGAFSAAPLIVAVQNSPSTLGPDVAVTTASATTTVATITWWSVPQASTAYTFTMFVRGTV